MTTKMIRKYNGKWKFVNLLLYFCSKYNQVLGQDNLINNYGKNIYNGNQSVLHMCDRKEYVHFLQSFW